MKLTKNILTRDEALAISPDYVAFVEGDHDKWNTINEAFEKLKRGQIVLTFHDGQFLKAKITSIDHASFRAIDGPVVRLGNGEATWRVDGDRYAYPIT